MGPFVDRGRTLYVPGTSTVVARVSISVVASQLLEGYCSLVSELDPTYFGNDARAYFLASFCKKDEFMSGEPLFQYFQDSRNKMRSFLVPLLPKDFMAMKSWRGFHKTCHYIVVAQFWKEYVTGASFRLAMSQAEADQMIPPPFWEYRKQAALDPFPVCQEFRRHLQLAPNVVEVLNDIANRPGSRADMKRKAHVAA